MYEIKYYKRGRLEYNTEFHARQFEPWTPEEDLYLMKFYKIDGLKMRKDYTHKLFEGDDRRE